MSESNITCPKCGAEIPLSEAVSHRLRERLAADFERQRAELNLALKKREQQLETRRIALEERAKSLQAEVARQVEAERQKLRVDSARQAEEKFGAELKDLHNLLADQSAKLKVAQDAEVELRKKQRDLEDAKRDFELQLARKLDEERHNIADAACQQATEVERLKLADKQKVITDLQHQIAQLKQRAEQGSMQLQGETLELELERELRAAFPFDQVDEVKKGIRGADCVQCVRAGSGLECGTILWEAKRARNWSPDWPEKLKGDQREVKAEFAVIVTTCPPAGIRGIGQSDGVWVCDPALAVALAAALRQGLIGAAAQRVQQANRTEKMAMLYDHLCSVEFRQHIEAVVESFLALQEQLAAEQRAFARQWKEREQQLRKAIAHTAMLYGGIQGIAGREALPEIGMLELLGGDSFEKADERALPDLDQSLRT
jgi:hypothetical protein